MMDRMRHQELEARMMDEIVRRRQLGEYNQDAKSILLLYEVMYELLREAGPKAKIIKE